jgi:hypothetical protein
MVLGRTVEELERTMTNPQFLRWYVFARRRIEEKQRAANAKPQPKQVINWWD